MSTGLTNRFMDLQGIFWRADRVSFVGLQEGTFDESLF